MLKKTIDDFGKWKGEHRTRTINDRLASRGSRYNKIYKIDIFQQN